MSEPRHDGEIAIIGAGIAGLTFGLALHARGIPCRIFERSEAIMPLGVGINVLPHASRVLADLGLAEALGAVSVLARASAFFNRFGQLIYREPLGVEAGYPTPQYSIHRGDLQTALLDAFVARRKAGEDALPDRVERTKRLAPEGFNAAGILPLTGIGRDRMPTSIA